MIIKYHEPLGDPNSKQYPLPENWREISVTATIMPENFGVVEKGKLYKYLLTKLKNPIQFTTICIMQYLKRVPMKNSTILENWRLLITDLKT